MSRGITITASPEEVTEAVIEYVLTEYLEEVLDTGDEE